MYPMSFFYSTHRHVQVILHIRPLCWHTDPTLRRLGGSHWRGEQLPPHPCLTPRLYRAKHDWLCLSFRLCDLLQLTARNCLTCTLRFTTTYNSIVTESFKVFPPSFIYEKTGDNIVVAAPRDLFTAANLVKFKVPWEDKVPTAFFRGTATGGGVTTATNQRLHIAQVCKNWDNAKTYPGLCGRLKSADAVNENKGEH